jgi:hypothetical protein
MKKKKGIAISSVLLFLLGLATFVAGTVPETYGNKVKAGEFVVEPPTLICLGFEWRIDGDDNRNATVEVHYHKKGDPAWKEAQPLFRLQREQAGGDGTIQDYVIPNMFAGSILDLEPDTEYECKFSLADPDGVIGTRQKIVTVRTRPEPKPFAAGKTLHVYPAEYKGPKEKPAFVGLKSAYEEAEPGDIILVHAGLYQSDRTRYLDYLRKGIGSDVFGTSRLTKSGTAEKPIAIKGAGDGEAIFDGNACSLFFDVMGANYLYFEGLTFRNADVAFLTGLKNVAGCSGLTIKKCRFENVAEAIRGTYQGSKNYYIADNVIIGRNNPTRLLGLISREVRYDTQPGYPPSVGGPNGSNNAITVAGQGHVVCYNYVANFFDGIDTNQSSGAPAEGQVFLPPLAIDFYNNYISNISDNCFETDCSTHNVRVMRNMCINNAHGTLSSQPVYGGPVYWIRNIVYHAPDRGALKLYARPAGVILYHNTFCAEAIVGQPSGLGASNVHFRNNLILGENPESMVSYFPKDFRGIFYMDTYTSYSTADYDGFRPNEGNDMQFAWNSPAGGARSDYKNPREVHVFKTPKELCAAMGQECHAILVDYDIFQNVKKADMANFSKVYNAKDMDFRLKPGSVAVDAGCILPNINDVFTGKAPDLGALEVGQPAPIYGPRP